ncbi:hypothetical protein HK099_007821 [Clydaea vesicula]|uniref:UBA domain-containing protein n=1 Tax=Clydaea vesicula TaxID=447962 RepID=A0AAD5U933_9FUNG|nr:hypothetical protein HK099_007821 [Clydaea vesicula]
MNIHEKSLFYLLSFQLIFTDFTSIIPSISGLIAGIIWNSSKKLQKAASDNFIIKSLEPLFLYSNSSSRRGRSNIVHPNDDLRNHISNDIFGNPRNTSRSSQPNPIPRPEIVINEDHVTSLMDLGFTREQCVEALRVSDNDADRAAGYLFG